MTCSQNWKHFVSISTITKSSPTIEVTHTNTHTHTIPHQMKILILCFVLSVASAFSGGGHFPNNNIRISNPLLNHGKYSLSRQDTLLYSATDESEKESKVSKKAALGIFTAVTSIFSVFITGFGALFTLGLMLNIMGYGYMFTPESGLRIDTIQEFQMEQTLRQVSTASSIVVDREPQSTSAMVAFGNFFRKSPFLATLIITGLALVYEEIFKERKK